jgi:hypothetical protein
MTQPGRRTPRCRLELAIDPGQNSAPWPDSRSAIPIRIESPPQKSQQRRVPGRSWPETSTRHARSTPISADPTLRLLLDLKCPTCTVSGRTSGYPQLEEVVDRLGFCDHQPRVATEI